MDITRKRLLTQVSLVLLAILVLVILFFVGIFIGFVVIGKGAPSDAFNSTNWHQIIEIIKQ
ncbi:hypothetical protein CBF34_04635 [Vagococcus penaei]|uniref:Uncharacterized protein n=1 Tax=Vagococcus penaei TaxID=633807 RepID=A0A1Q2D4K4_9ENTE|nr:DNA-directed RNA polymerase subunit beta [Vagococcus penaei]AQP53312.1 hypothetical protein BW732_03060 [Vagococcus penaei]RSU04082.1 hypothetical protein CBF34_04635 [Vagococcus penaei]